MPKTTLQLNLLRDTLEPAPYSVVITNQAGGVQWVNPAFATLFGYGAAEAAGHAPRLRPFGEHSGHGCAGFWRTILGGETWSELVWNRRKDGTRFQTRAVVFPLMTPAGELAWLVAMHSLVGSAASSESEVATLAAALNQCHSGGGVLSTTATTPGTELADDSRPHW